MPAYANLNSKGLFSNLLGLVTPFVRWIEDYPLPNGLKIPSHIGSYDGKGDPDNFLHLFEGAIRMQKWLMLVACHMFTYTVKDSARIWWNSQKAGSILDYKDLKAKFQAHLRENESTRAFITRYTDDTLQILGLHEDQRISGFIHGLRTRSLVEHLSTDLPPTYKGLMEKTYTWVEAREVATNGVSNDRRDSFERPRKSSWNNNKGQMDRSRSFPYKGESHKLLSNLVKSPREILATERVAKTFERPPRLPGPNWSKDKTRYCHFHKDYGHETNKCQELKHQIEEAVKTGQLTHLVKGVTKKREKTSDTQSGEKKKEEKPTLEKTSILMLKPSIRSLRVDSNTPLVGFSGEESWLLGEVPLEVIIGEGPLTMAVRRSTIRSHNRRRSPHDHKDTYIRNRKRLMEEEEGNSTNNGQGDAKDILSCIDTEEKIVIDDEYPKQKVTIGRQLPTRIKMWLEETFSTKHQLNMFNHTESVKQKKRSLAPERNEAIRTQVEELVEAGVLREVKYQTWVSNLIIVKKDDGKWKMRIDFTIINKACIREPHPLPAAELGVENLLKYRLKCFLDAYKGYHQIPMAEKDEEKTAFFTREGVVCYRRLPFSLKNAGATYQRLIYKVFDSQIGRNMEVNADDMVIKSDSEEEMLYQPKQVQKHINNNPYTSFGFVMSLNDYRGLDVPTAKLFLIPTGKLTIPAGSLWFLLVVPAGRLCGSCWSAYGFFC
ncbi:reverse transcriptase domain-containing protein [Tanacetum coccineum]